MEEKMSIIMAKITAIEDKLDRVIKALQEHDGVDEDFNEPYDEYAWNSVSSASVEKDIMSWNVDGAERRMDIIGQNGNEGLHYEEKPKPKRRYYKPKKKK
tara:strand:- start:622 stop:921 length:300 start_codon:yes stop_codon:yes gene_type:complete